MSRFAHEHPDDPEGAWDALVDRADHARKEAREAGSLTDEIFNTVRSATAALYPEARIPETPMRKTEPRFTPGPWTVILRGKRGTFYVPQANSNEAEHFYIPEAHKHEAEHSDDGVDGHTISGANARLIASAPEMYEVLAIVLQLWEEGTRGTTPFPADRIRAALAKARGEP